MIQDLRKQLEQEGFGDISDVSRRRVCIKELDAENKELGMEIGKQTEAGAEKKDPLPNPSLVSVRYVPAQTLPAQVAKKMKKQGLSFEFPGFIHRNNMDENPPLDSGVENSSLNEMCISKISQIS